MKFDEDKARWDLLPFDLIEQTVQVLTFGANKYAPNNWKTVDKERYWAALWRHLVAWRKGEILDAESKLTHAAHAMCNMLFIHELEEGIMDIHLTTDEAQALKAALKAELGYNPGNSGIIHEILRKIEVEECYEEKKHG